MTGVSSLISPLRPATGHCRLPAPAVGLCSRTACILKCLFHFTHLVPRLSHDDHDSIAEVKAVYMEEPSSVSSSPENYSP